VNDTLFEVCHYLRNWFERDKYVGEFTIADGQIGQQYYDGLTTDKMQLDGAPFIRIINSHYNDGIHNLPIIPNQLQDETFDGGVWTMYVPAAVLSIVHEIELWQQKYGGADGALNSPYTSESFGGYSYSKAGGGDSANGGGGTSWKDVFGSRLWQWRKL